MASSVESYSPRAFELSAATPLARNSNLPGNGMSMREYAVDVPSAAQSNMTQRIIDAGIDVREIPGDYWHPSDAAARGLAQYLSDAALLAEPQSPRSKR